MKPRSPLGEGGSILSLALKISQKAGSASFYLLNAASFPSQILLLQLKDAPKDYLSLNYLSLFSVNPENVLSDSPRPA